MNRTQVYHDVATREIGFAPNLNSKRHDEGIVSRADHHLNRLKLLC